MCDSLLTSTLLTTLQSRCYGSLGSSYYMFELTSSPYEWKEFVYQGILDFVYLKEYKSRLAIEHRTLVSRFATSCTNAWFLLQMHCLIGNSICHPCFEWQLKHLFPFPCGMKFSWLEERRNRQIVPFLPWCLWMLETIN
jgi:hypothetical protein